MPNLHHKQHSFGYILRALYRSAINLEQSDNVKEMTPPEYQYWDEQCDNKYITGTCIYVIGICALKKPFQVGKITR